MSRWRLVEELFARLASLTCARSRWVLAASALAVGALGSQAVHVQVDTSPEGMLHADDPLRQRYDAFRDEFGSDQLIVVGVGAPERFDADFLERLRALHRDLETRVPLVRKVDSLVNARFTRGEQDDFVVGELLPAWEARGRDPASLQRFALGHPLYRDNLISADGRFVALTIETEARLDGDPASSGDLLAAFEDDVGAGPEDASRRYLASRERSAVVAAVRSVLADHRAAEFPVHLSGTPVVVDAFDHATMADVTLCGSASAVAIVLILAWFFRRATGVLLPNLVVVAALASTFGLMGLTGAPFTLTTNTIIPVLITVGVCSSIHLLAIFYRSFESGVEKRAAIVHAVGHAGPAIAMTSLTTAAGLFSFALSDLSSTAEMGRYAASGVLFCMLFTLLLLPAALERTPVRREVRNPATSARTDRLLVALARFSTRRHRAILLASAAIAVLSLQGVLAIRFSHDPISYFPADAPVRTDLAVIDRELRGGTTLEVVLDSGRENGLYEPALLRAVDALAGELPSSTGHLLPVSRVFSVNDIVKETHQALNGNDPARYTLPGDRETLSQELFLFENSGSPDLGRLVDPLYRQARLTIKTPYADGVVYRDFVAGVRRQLDDALPGVPTVLTGGMALEAEAVPRALESMRESYVSAFLGIGVLMIVFLGSLRLGLASMVPNLLPIAAALSLMGWLDVPLDMTTITIGSIGLGLVVDDTIHFMHHYRRNRERTGDVEGAVEATFLGTGRAMMVTSLVLIGTFWVDLLASLANVVRFGVFIGVIVIRALLADLLVAPALMRALDGRRERARAPAAWLPRRSSTLLLALAFLAAAPSAAGADEARAIMQRVEARDDGEHARMELEMRLVDAAGRTRERRARLLRRDRDDGTDSILFFVEPADVRGTGFLTLDHDDPARSDDQWLYLPSLGRAKRIATTDKSRSFLGSDFSYADMTRRSIAHYDYRLMGERAVDGHPCWQIEAIPRSPHEQEETGYQRSILFVRQDADVVVRAVHWLRDSDRIKYFDVQRLEQVEGIWTSLEIEMTTRRGSKLEHRTVLRNRDVSYRTSVPAHYFTEQRLGIGP